jgi:hypothetical protein
MACRPFCPGSGHASSAGAPSPLTHQYARQPERKSTTPLDHARCPPPCIPSLPSACSGRLSPGMVCTTILGATVAPQCPPPLAGVDPGRGVIGRTTNRLASRPGAPAPNGVASPDHPSQDGSLAAVRARSTNRPVGPTTGSDKRCADLTSRSSQTAFCQAVPRLAARWFSLYWMVRMLNFTPTILPPNIQKWPGPDNRSGPLWRRGGGRVRCTSRRSAAR